MNLPLQLDRTAQIPLQDQLFEQLRQLILTGRLKPNTRLIATRFLAEQVGVSRRTVLFAYERLISEGYLETRPAIGTFVSPTLPDDVRPGAAMNGFADVPRHAALYPAINGCRMIRPIATAVRFDFISPYIDTGLALTPKMWQRRMRDVLDTDPAIYARPAPTAGVEPLRRVIADYLAATRGILATPEQVVIVSGRRLAFGLVARLFAHRGGRIVVEAPCADGLENFYRNWSDDLVGVAVDEFGLDTDRLPHGPTYLVHVTPARQDPLGGTMPPVRRAVLIEWARKAGAYVVEDDCGGELRYQGVTHPPLAAIDPYGLVFYVGTFANVLGGGLGLSYMLVPPEFSEAVAAVKEANMDGGQSFEQMVVASFIAGGEYDHHLRRLRKALLERRDTLMATLKKHFGDVNLVGTATGTSLSWLLPPSYPPAPAICAAAADFGVSLTAVAGLQLRDSPLCETALILNYAALTPEMLRQGVSELARAMHAIRR